MVALVSGLRMLFATGAAYGRKVAALHKPCMPALLRMISPLTMRLLPKPGKSSSTNRHRMYASRLARDFEVFACVPASASGDPRSEEHTSELQSLMRISYAVFCLKKKNKQ